MTLRAGVAGSPAKHSLSPVIHRAWLEAAGIDGTYDIFDLARDGFADFVQEARCSLRGLNVTIPFKEEALAAADQVSARAKRAGAANLLIFEDGAVRADNTDGLGLLAAFAQQAPEWRADAGPIVVLGAGGAARGVAPALLDAGISELIIVNRTAERADALADALGEPDRAQSRYWRDLGDLGDFSLIVNATSASRQDQGEFSLPFHLATPRTLAVDLNYGEAAIPFLAWARAAGCHDAVDGLGMLVEQAAEAFEQWHGVRPETDAVYAALRDRDKVLVTAD